MIGAAVRCKAWNEKVHKWIKTVVCEWWKINLVLDGLKLLQNVLIQQQTRDAFFKSSYSMDASSIVTNRVHWNFTGLQAAPQNIAFTSLNYFHFTSSYWKLILPLFTNSYTSTYSVTIRFHLLTFINNEQYNIYYSQSTFTNTFYAFNAPNY